MMDGRSAIRHSSGAGFAPGSLGSAAAGSLHVFAHGPHAHAAHSLQTAQAIHAAAAAHAAAQVAHVTAVHGDVHAAVAGSEAAAVSRLLAPYAVNGGFAVGGAGGHAVAGSAAGLLHPAVTHAYHQNPYALGHAPAAPPPGFPLAPAVTGVAARGGAGDALMDTGLAGSVGAVGVASAASGADFGRVAAGSALGPVLVPNNAYMIQYAPNIGYMGLAGNAASSMMTGLAAELPMVPRAVPPFSVMLPSAAGPPLGVVTGMGPAIAHGMMPMTMPGPGSGVPAFGGASLAPGLPHPALRGPESTLAGISNGGIVAHGSHSAGFGGAPLISGQLAPTGSLSSAWDDPMGTDGTAGAWLGDHSAAHSGAAPAPHGALSTGPGAPPVGMSAPMGPPAPTPTPKVSPELAAALKSYNSGAYEDCAAACSKLLASNPDDVNVLLLLGATHFQQRNLDASLRYSTRAVELKPDFAEALGNIGNVYKDRGDLDTALQFYRRAQAIKPSFADVHGNMASVLLQQGHNEDALVHFEHAIRLRPDNACWQVDLGHLYRMFGHIDRAEACFRTAIRLNPSFPIAWSNLACIFKDKGNVPEAVRHYRRAIELDPACVAAHSNLGNVLKDAGQLRDAVVEYEAALHLGGENAVVLANLAATQLELGMLEPSLETFNKALALNPAFPDALSNRGNAYKLLGRISDAVSSYEEALRHDPDHPDALNNLANTYRDLGRAREAEEMYRHAIRVRPHFAGAHSNLGNLLKEQHKMHEALAEYQLAISYDPNFTNAYANMGNTLKDLGRFPEAIAAYLKAIELQPSFADAYANLASVYKDSGRFDEAIANYRQALAMKESAGLPTDPIAWCNLVHTLQTVCDWRDRDAIFAKTWEIIHEQMSRSEVPAVQPHHALAYPFSAAKQLEIAQHYAMAPLRNVLSLGLKPYEYESKALAGRLSADRGRRLRLGYVSSDFGNHPLAHLMQHVFQWHDRRSFEVFCFATSPSDGSQWRLAIQNGVEHFIDVASRSHGDLAAYIHELEIDILVNLNGYTKGSRNDVFALQPAPIQVMYMGFPGSSGSQYHQYYVSDAIASPPELAHLFTERLAYMPHCYFVNDHAQSYADAVGRLSEPDDATVNSIRAAYGLPPRPAVVYCMFNQLYKIAPEVFDVWMRILSEVPGSVLWLLTFPENGKENIVNEAVRRGMDPSRLIFSPVASKEEHISRGRAADLFLDTTQCNAHTTATDILWGGTPLLTCPSESLASRVASSIVAALGCPELSVSTLDEYAAFAIEVGNNLEALRALQHKVCANRAVQPLFNTAKWVHDFDRLLLAMAEDHRLGLLGEERPPAVAVDPEPFGDERVTLAPPPRTTAVPLTAAAGYPAAGFASPHMPMPVQMLGSVGGLQPPGVFATPTALAPTSGRPFS